MFFRIPAVVSNAVLFEGQEALLDPKYLKKTEQFPAGGLRGCLEWTSAS